MVKGCGCGARAPQSVIDQARELNKLVGSGEYRSLDLAALSDDEFDAWVKDHSAFGEYHGYTISGLSKDRLRRALW